MNENNNQNLSQKFNRIQLGESNEWEEIELELRTYTIHTHVT